MRGLLTAKTSPDAGTVKHKYDRAGHLRYRQDANQAAAGQVHFTTYDFAGRPLVSGVGAATFSTLNPDAASPPSLETTQANWRTVWEYDAKPSTTAFPWSLFGTQIGALTLSKVAGRLAAVASQSNGAWQATLYSYDADGRIASRYTYTQNNAGTAVLTALNTTTTYVRDLRDAITQRTLTVGSSTFRHWYDYDGRGLLWKVYASSSSTKPATPDVTYAYRPGGEVEARQYAGGPLVPMRYTIREQLERIGSPASTSYPFSARYAYHGNGAVKEAEFYSADSPAASKRYKYAFGTASYDALNRLKSADFSSWSGSAWTSTLAHDLAGISYDKSGNLTALKRYRGSATLLDNLSYSYPGTSNRLSSVADAVGATAEGWDAEAGSFTYDANGNVKTAPAPYSITALTYDHRNLPLSLTRSGTTTTYRYNEAGQRIAKRVGAGNTEVYVLDGSTTLGVFTVNASGTPASWYFNVLAGERVVGRQPGTGARRYYHTDLLGSTRAVVQGAAVVESYDPDPWGVLMPGRTLGSGTKEGFTGKERDTESGLDYFGARLYMAALGRWTTVDLPADSFPEWSPYNYVENSPATLIDPFGLCAGDDYFYDECGQLKYRVENKEAEDRHYMIRSNGTTMRLDGQPIARPEPYKFMDEEGALDETAIAIAKAEDNRYTIVGVRRESGANERDLDFKPDVNQRVGVRTLWNAGFVDGELVYVHNDKVANTAWGYYIHHRALGPVPLSLALRKAREQAERVGAVGETLDQVFIKRGWYLSEN